MDLDVSIGSFDWISDILTGLSQLTQKCILHATSLRPLARKPCSFTTASMPVREFLLLGAVYKSLPY